jgi:hypothetical protein
MEEKRSDVDRHGGLEGADAASLGLTPEPQSAPPGARVDPDEDLVPGADLGDQIPDEAKPWFTSLAAESDHAGVENEPMDVEEDVERG